jgi:hypothetical protein
MTDKVKIMAKRTALIWLFFIAFWLGENWEA